MKKALTTRQEKALAVYRAGGKIDKGMIRALTAKGVLDSALDTVQEVKDAGPYVIYNPTQKNRIVQLPGNGVGVKKNARYASEGAAKAGLTRLKNKAAQYALEGKRLPSHCEGVNEYVICPLAEYNALDTQVERRNFMTGEAFLEDVNTPYYCSPSSETYWSA